MLACDCGNVCMWVLTSMQEWAWMCMSVCWHVWPFFIHVCIVSLHVCAHTHVLTYVCCTLTCMYVCMRTISHTPVTQDGFTTYSQPFSLWSGQESKETLALCLNFVLNIWSQIFFSHGSIISPEATSNWIPNIDVNFSKIEILSGLLAYFQTK